MAAVKKNKNEYLFNSFSTKNVQRMRIFRIFAKEIGQHQF